MMEVLGAKCNAQLVKYDINNHIGGREAGAALLAAQINRVTAGLNCYFCQLCESS
ncbi:MAG TPA: hypothetical protein VIX14_12815 [Terriglobales bacterium]